MLSPKQIGTICFAIFSILISAPSFADPDIAPSASTADCKNNPLDTYSGTSNLQADWRANEIALHWYDGDTELTVAEESQTCTYDGILTPPTTIPTKTGYTFTGWRVRIPVCTASIASAAKNLFGFGGVLRTGYTRLDGVTGSNETLYGLTTPGEWAVESKAGIIKGIAKCSNTNGGGWATPGTPSDTDGQYCWCQATNYTPRGGNQCNFSSSSWVFAYDDGDADGCASGCASSCSDGVGTVVFRHALLGGQ